MSGIVLNTAIKSTLLSLQRTSNLVDQVTLRLATGKKVNSALDNPQNFFTAFALENRASDLSRLLDGISQNIRAIELASSGLEATSRLIDQAEELAIRQRDEVVNAIDVPGPLNGQSHLSNLITEKEADFYFRLDDGGPAVDDAGDVGTSSTYAASVTTQSEGLFKGSNGSAYFNGTDASVNIGFNSLISGNFTQKTIELVFNADTTSGRQTIYSQGNNTRGIDIYIDNGELYITALNSPSFGGASAIPQPVFQKTIEADRNYHVALVFSRDENRIESYVNGISLGSSEVGNGIFFGHNAPTLGRQNTGSKSLHDGISTSNNFYRGFISDVAIHNTILTNDEIAEHATAAEANNLDSRNADYNSVLENIRRVAVDSNYRGLNLLSGQSLFTQFNPSGTSTLITEGIDLIGHANGIPFIGFDDEDDLNEMIISLKAFRKTIRSYASSLTSDLNIIKIRRNFTQEQVTTLRSGRDDLTLANQNKDGATLLALQTRQQLGVTALSLAAQSTQQTLRLF